MRFHIFVLQPVPFHSPTQKSKQSFSFPSVNRIDCIKFVFLTSFDLTKWFKTPGNSTHYDRSGIHCPAKSSGCQRTMTRQSLISLLLLETVHSRRFSGLSLFGCRMLCSGNRLAQMIDWLVAENRQASHFSQVGLDLLMMRGHSAR